MENWLVTVQFATPVSEEFTEEQIIIMFRNYLRSVDSNASVTVSRLGGGM